MTNQDRFEKETLDRASHGEIVMSTVCFSAPPIFPIFFFENEHLLYLFSTGKYTKSVKMIVLCFALILIVSSIFKILFKYTWHTILY